MRKKVKVIRGAKSNSGLRVTKKRKGKGLLISGGKSRYISNAQPPTPSQASVELTERSEIDKVVAECNRNRPKSRPYNSGKKTGDKR